MPELRSSLPKLLMESVLIVFSVLLALGVDEWREKRQTQQRVDQALESFAREIQRNQQSVRKVLPYHERLQRHFSKLSLTRVQKVSDLQQMEGFQGFQTLELEDAAWQTATATGALADLDYETASLLSRVYASQKDFATRQSMIFTVLQPAGLTSETLPLSIGLLAGYSQDVTVGEQGLLRDYAAVEKRLETLGVQARS
jgi:type II secretory pathway pseudopilin PulG